MASLGKLALVALLTEDAILLVYEAGVLHRLVTAAAHKVLCVPHLTYCRCIGTSV